MIKALIKTPLILLILLVILLSQIMLLYFSRYTIWPEMILYPYLMNSGFALYRDIINPYFPLFSNVLSLYFSIVGLSILNLKLFTFFIILVINVIVFGSSYALSRSLIKAILASFLYVLLQYSFGGNGLWFELVLAPFAILGIVVVYLNSKTRRFLVVVGFLLSLGVLIKQNAVLFYIPVIYLLIIRRQIRNIFYLLLPGVLLGVITLIYLFSLDLFSYFYKWAVLLPLTFSSQSGFVSMPAIRQYVFIFFPVISLGGILKFNTSSKEKVYWVLCFLVALSFAFPRYEDFHLQVLIAFSAILASFLPIKYWLFFTMITFLLFIRSVGKLLYQEDRFMDSETLELAEKVKDYDSIYLLNSPDLVYYLAGKIPPKPWAINFPWYFESFDFERRFIQGLDNAEPKFIIIADGIGGGKYALGNYFPDELMIYIMQNYHKREKYKKFWIWQKI